MPGTGSERPGILLEICAGSMTGALLAQYGGADRIELCENLGLGGTTPSFGTLHLALHAVRIPVHVLIRPRAGNFVYSDLELAVMKTDIEACKQLGAAGVVFGALTANNLPDENACNLLLSAARPMSVTFHRAFDAVPDPLESMETLIRLGFDRILTSGRQPTALQGIPLLKQLAATAAGRIVIMPGGNVRPGNLMKVVSATGVSEVHSAALHADHPGDGQTDPAMVSEMKSLLSLPRTRKK